MNNDQEQSSESENEDRVTVIENFGHKTEIIEEKESSKIEYEESEAEKIAERTVETLRVPVISTQPDLRHWKITG